MKLSIIIPAFNEEKTVAEIVSRVKKQEVPGVDKEIVVVNDGSSDKTTEILEEIGRTDKSIKIVHHPKNKGKGAAVKTGIANSTGDYIIIQDADLEYNPNDIPKLLAPVLGGKAKVVYGTRLNRMPHVTGEEKRFLFLLHFFGNRMLSLLTSVLYFSWITDMETCYKLFPRKALDGIELRSRSFDFEPEITSKLLKKGYKIAEVNITTKPRGYEEGKKLNTIRDGSIALWTLFKYRFID
ncbi:MAG: glycosyl transferase [Candidatus Levybacteria bacterium RIFOXYA1_FULL_41_10]|nr:MAG: Glycosyl transferase family 2 [Candidatus Levybacteria bacterium GW2011_GWA2_36_13]KKQ00433.1 MAG: Glycosyl transferase family 2 [Candidatus Levybacteria bacterium GW2011_GWB1_36_18]KKR16097.1 MAG: Glycosyl transferase family 2 [Candidatus Levybacteria bacterium GW2011_GWA1_39_32]KKR51134.1 MAG: Glycosyl transferase family 2 [Candidatus Levybacteria bacterium GW2011_GWC1_40_19]KKR73434.1 MAG: Glycosyl transferase family 2 [Candidatus Levybacteria bacterium GW2011_GWC2_40_7]OGH20348.1 M